MAVFILEDLQSTVEVMVFPKTMTEHGHMLADDAVVCVKARVDKRDDSPSSWPWRSRCSSGIADGAPPVRIKLSPQRVERALCSASSRGCCSEHPGESQVFLHLGERQMLRLPDQFCVDLDRRLRRQLRVLLGPDAIVVVNSPWTAPERAVRDLPSCESGPIPLD